MSTKKTLRELVRAITKGDSAASSSLFRKALAERVKLKIQSMKKELAKTMFK